MLFSSSINLYHTNLGLLKPTRRSPPIEIRNFILDHNFSSSLKLCGSQREQRRNLQPLKMVLVRCMDEDSIGATFDDWGDSDGMSEGSSYILPSSGEESDVELLISADFSSTDHLGSSDGISMTSPNLVIDRKRRKIHRILPGVLINAGLIAFVVVLLLLVDWCSWRIVRLPLAPFFLTRPFLISAVLASCAGYLCVPVLDSLRIHQIFSREGPKKHSRKKGTPTLGGLFFIPIGIVTAITIVGSSSVEVFGVAVATVAFGAIGLIDDLFRFIKNRKYGLPTWIRVLLEVAVGLSFFFWLDSTNISSPYSMKMLIPLPSPVGLVSLGKLYAVLTTLCFVSMGNGINLTDGLDGLAGGTAALAFIGMSIAVLPISSDLAVFGASMAGSCIGFLVHNRYRASIFMGDTGSLALGGSLAAMAACTGMFCPLFISSGVFLLEALSVIVQISNWRDRRRWIHRRAGGRLFWMAPLHYRLELCGFKEPLIVGCAYVVSSLLSMFAGYVGLISA